MEHALAANERDDLVGDSILVEFTPKSPPPMKLRSIYLRVLLPE
jgi:hypothetical protein